MAVYVDSIMNWVKTGKWKYDGSCHMFADTLEELHELASRIGLKKSWFQNRPDLPHYDLTSNKRSQAVAAGAQEVDHEFVVQVMRQNREVRIETGTS